MIIADLSSVYAAMKVATTGDSIVIPSNDAQFRHVSSEWLLRHWKEVHDLHVRTKQGAFHAHDAVLVVRLEGGAMFLEAWMDRNILARWLCRPVLRGHPVYWNHRAYIIGSTDYKQDLNPKENNVPATA